MSDTAQLRAVLSQIQSQHSTPDQLGKAFSRFVEVSAAFPFDVLSVVLSPQLVSFLRTIQSTLVLAAASKNLDLFLSATRAFEILERSSPSLQFGQFTGFLFPIISDAFLPVLQGLLKSHARAEPNRKWAMTVFQCIRAALVWWMRMAQRQRTQRRAFLVLVSPASPVAEADSVSRLPVLCIIALLRSLLLRAGRMLDLSAPIVLSASPFSPAASPSPAPSASVEEQLGAWLHVSSQSKEETISAVSVSELVTLIDRVVCFTLFHAEHFSSEAAINSWVESVAAAAAASSASASEGALIASKKRKREEDESSSDSDEEGQPSKKKVKLDAEEEKKQQKEEKEDEEEKEEKAGSSKKDNVRVMLYRLLTQYCASVVPGAAAPAPVTVRAHIRTSVSDALAEVGSWSHCLLLLIVVSRIVLVGDSCCLCSTWDSSAALARPSHPRRSRSLCRPACPLLLWLRPLPRRCSLKRCCGC